MTTWGHFARRSRWPRIVRNLFAMLAVGSAIAATVSAQPATQPATRPADADCPMACVKIGKLLWNAFNTGSDSAADATGAHGLGAAMGDLPQYTGKAGTLYVFSLP